MMQRFSKACYLIVGATAALLAIGCSNPAQNAIYAQVPGSNRPISTKTPNDGQYTLYQVTQFNEAGQPADAKVIITYHLPRGEPIGFRWVSDRSQFWKPDAAMRLEAFAGDHVNDLGHITSVTEKYYWANPSDWGHYWTVEPAFGVEKSLLMQGH